MPIETLRNYRLLPGRLSGVCFLIEGNLGFLLENTYTLLADV